MSESTKEHVSIFLAALDGSEPSEVSNFTDVSTALGRLASSDAAAQGALAETIVWFRSLSISEKTYSIHQRLIHADGPAPTFEVSPAWTGASLASLAAQKGVVNALKLVEDDGKRFRAVVLDTPRKLAALEPDFVDELLVETAIRQARDPDLGERLREGRFGIIGLARQLQGSVRSDLLEQILGNLDAPAEPAPRAGQVSVATSFESSVVARQKSWPPLVALYYTLAFVAVVMGVAAKAGL